MVAQEMVPQERVVWVVLSGSATAGFGMTFAMLWQQTLESCGQVKAWHNDQFKT